MIFDICINKEPEFETTNNNNFVAIWEEVDTIEGIGTIHELVNEIAINNIVDGKKVIVEMNQFDSYDDYLDTLETIDDPMVSIIEDGE